MKKLLILLFIGYLLSIFFFIIILKYPNKIEGNIYDNFPPSTESIFDTKLDKIYQAFRQDCTNYYDRLDNEFDRELVFFAILIGLFGVVAPIWINHKYEEQVEKKFKEHLITLESNIAEQNSKLVNEITTQKQEIQNKIDEIENIKSMVENYKKQSEISSILSQAQSIQKREPERAIALYSQVLNKVPNDKTALLLRGIRYKVTKQYKKALGDLSSVIRLDPQNARAYNNIGSVYLKTGLFHNALENYNKALELDPGYVAVHVNKGLLYFQMDELDKSLDCYKQAVLCNEDSLGGHMGIRKIYMIKYKRECDLSKREDYFKIMKEENHKILEIQEKRPY